MMYQQPNQEVVVKTEVKVKKEKLEIGSDSDKKERND